MKLHGEVVNLDMYTATMTSISEANRLFRSACKLGDLRSIEMLARSFPVSLNIGANSNEAIRSACQNGHTEAVQFILDHWGSVIDGRAVISHVLEQTVCDSSFCGQHDSGFIKHIWRTVRILLKAFPEAIDDDITKILRGLPKTVKLYLQKSVSVSLIDDRSFMIRTSHEDNLERAMKQIEEYISASCIIFIPPDTDCDDNFEKLE